MRTDPAATSMSSDRVAIRPIVDRQTPVRTLPSLAVGRKKLLVVTKLFNTEMTAADDCGTGNHDPVMSLALDRWTGVT